MSLILHLLMRRKSKIRVRAIFTNDRRKDYEHSVCKSKHGRPERGQTD